MGFNLTKIYHGGLLAGIPFSSIFFIDEIVGFELIINLEI
jgi:hypothetical protein